MENVRLAKSAYPSNIKHRVRMKWISDPSHFSVISDIIHPTPCFGEQAYLTICPISSPSSSFPALLLPGPPQHSLHNFVIHAAIKAIYISQPPRERGSGAAQSQSPKPWIYGKVPCHIPRIFSASFLLASSLSLF